MSQHTQSSGVGAPGWGSPGPPAAGSRHGEATAPPALRAGRVSQCGWTPLAGGPALDNRGCGQPKARERASPPRPPGALGKRCRGARRPGRRAGVAAPRGSGSPEGLRPVVRTRQLQSGAFGPRDTGPGQRPWRSLQAPPRHGEPRQAWRTARGTGTDRALGSLRLQRRRARGAGARRQRGQVRFPRRDPAPRVGGAPAAGVPCTPLQLQRRGVVPWDKRMAAAPFPDQPSVWRSPPRGTLGRGCWKPLGYFLFGFVGKS